jgi:hypothetical protein
MHNSVQVPGLTNALRSSGLQDGAVTIGLQEQFSTFKIVGENDLRTTESNLELIKNLSVTQITAAYNISSSWALQANVPFIVRDYETFERYKKVRDTEAGIGDVPLGIVTYARSGRATLFASAQYTIRTEGAADYRFSDDISWSAAPGWLFLLGEDQNLTASIVCSGENKASDHLNGTLLPRTAANNVYLGPEIFYSAANRIFIQLAVDLPVATDVGGAAVKPETRSRFSFTWSF